MTDNTEPQQIEQCLFLIEEQLQWGESKHWTNLDFEKLSDSIHQKTGVILSITTLKRLWGRLKYNSNPAQTTLNALAVYIGFEDWRAFIKSRFVAEKKPEKSKEQPSAKFKITSLLSLVAGIVIALIISFFVLKKDNVDPSSRSVVDQIFQKQHHPDDYSFEANKVITEGVPNSVIFTYDATASPSDSVFIVQNWDISRKTLVSKDKEHHSAIYYWPGFFRSKLIIEDQIVRTHDIQITSDGWLGLVETDEIPVYFSKSAILKENLVVVDDDLLEAHNLPLLPTSPKVRFFNQGDFGSLRNDNFTFQTTLKNDHYKGDNACQFVEILIQCKDDVFIIPISAKSCVGDLRLYVAGHTEMSIDNDLSGLGADLSSWTKVRVEVNDKNVQIFVNDLIAADFEFPHNPTDIVGLQYRFYGSASIREAWFENSEDRWDLFKPEPSLTADF